MGLIGRWLGSWFGNVNLVLHFHGPMVLNFFGANGKPRAHSPRLLEASPVQMRQLETPRLQIALAPSYRERMLSRPSNAAVRESWARTFKDIQSKRV